MFNLREYLKEKQSVINESLNRHIRRISTDYVSDRIVSAMEYSIMAGGKRLRPILCIAACEVVGGQIEKCMDAACALEMIHTYSLIHDDLPAMDNDDLRRGKPTCHVAFDEATAILAGDALLTIGFQILAAGTIEDNTDELRNRLNIIHRIAAAAGYNGMIAGQMLDILSEGKKLNIEELKQLHTSKTGALIEASVYTGALLGNATREQIDCLTDFSANIGLAFQVADDILNVEGDPAHMGKAVGTDNDRLKSTYPSLIGINASRQFAGELIGQALQALERFDSAADPLRAIARYIVERKH